MRRRTARLGVHALSITVGVLSGACSSRALPVESVGGAFGGPVGGGGSVVDASSPVSGGGDASSPASAVGASHPAWPQLVDANGSVITTPQIVTITFPGDALATELASFGDQLTTTSYWDTVRAGYCDPANTSLCIGRGAGASVALTTAPAASYTDSSRGGASSLRTLIENLEEAQQIPALGSQVIPVFYFPATTSISFDGAVTCQTIGGFHNSLLSKVSGKVVPYAVVAECAPPSGLTLLQETTFAASHEIFETATDPVASETTSGYYLDVADPSYLPWNAAMQGGEAADMCRDPLRIGQDRTTAGSFTVQRMWSNRAAAIGGDPCVPARSNPYFNAAVDRWALTQAVGSTTTFNAVAFSSGAVAGGWTVTALDLFGTDDDPNAYLTLSVGGGSAAVVNDGETFPVSVTLNQDPGSLTQMTGGAIGVLVSFTGPSLQEATAGAIWPFMVRTPADALDSGLANIDASEDMPLHSDVGSVQLRPRPLDPSLLRRLEARIHPAIAR
jgi:hypothetical protein